MVEKRGFNIAGKIYFSVLFTDILLAPDKLQLLLKPNPSRRGLLSCSF